MDKFYEYFKCRGNIKTTESEIDSYTHIQILTTLKEIHSAYINDNTYIGFVNLKLIEDKIKKYEKNIS